MWPFKDFYNVKVLMQSKVSPNVTSPGFNTKRQCLHLVAKINKQGTSTSDEATPTLTFIKTNKQKITSGQLKGKSLPSLEHSGSFKKAVL